MMTAVPPATDAERALADLFEARSAHFTKAPIDASRTDAFRRFQRRGLPHRRIEAYKYTDLKARLRQLPTPPCAATEIDVDGLLTAHPPLVEGAARIVIANGQFIAERSTTPPNARLHSILATEADTANVGSLVADSDDPLTLANVGLFEGGAVLHVDGAAGPVEIIHLAAPASLVMGRFAVFVASGASVSIVERFINGAGTVTNNLAEMIVEDRGRLEIVRVVHGVGHDSTDLSSHFVRMGEEAHLEHLTVSTGLGLCRSQAFCHVVGDDAVSNFRTATVALEKRHADNTLVMRHNALNGQSTEVFRSAVGQKGVAIVQGQIIVDPGAQKTDAGMMSNALFLDDTGEVVNKPELEIFADDVLCGHGATSGDLDEEPIFYLRARGIPEAVARRLLVEAFLVEALDNVEDEALKDALSGYLTEALSVVKAL